MAFLGHATTKPGAKILGLSVASHRYVTKHLLLSEQLSTSCLEIKDILIGTPVLLLLRKLLCQHTGTCCSLHIRECFLLENGKLTLRHRGIL